MEQWFGGKEPEQEVLQNLHFLEKSTAKRTTHKIIGEGLARHTPHLSEYEEICDIP